MKEITPDLAENVTITLNKAEALVLFEYLHRSEDEENMKRPRPQPDAAEVRVLWNLCADLESLLVEPFAPNYRQLIAEAKRGLTES